MANKKDKLQKKWERTAESLQVRNPEVSKQWVKSVFKSVGLD